AENFIDGKHPVLDGARKSAGTTERVWPEGPWPTPRVSQVPFGPRRRIPEQSARQIENRRLARNHSHGRDEGSGDLPGIQADGGKEAGGGHEESHEVRADGPADLSVEQQPGSVTGVAERLRRQ